MAASKATKKKAAKKKPAKKKASKAAKAPTKKAKPAKKAAAGPTKKKAASKKAAAKKAASAPAKKVTQTAKKPATSSASKKSASKTEKDSAKKAAAADDTTSAVDASASADAGSTKMKAKAGKKKKKDSAAGASTTGKKARPKKPVVPTGPRHPKLGYRWACFSCDAKFYDLGKEEPICPKCQSNQWDRPPEDPKQPTESPKPKVVRPMAQLLDDDEPVRRRGDDLALDKPRLSTPDEMFDDSDLLAGGIDVDDDLDLDDVVDSPEIDII